MVLSITLIIVYVFIIIKLRQRAKRWRGTYDPTTESEKVNIDIIFTRLTINVTNSWLAEILQNNCTCSPGCTL